MTDRVVVNRDSAAFSGQNIRRASQLRQVKHSNRCMVSIDILTDAYLKALVVLSPRRLLQYWQLACFPIDAL